MKSVFEVPVMPKTIILGHFSPSGFAQTVESPWVWSTSYLHCGKQRCVWTPLALSFFSLLHIVFLEFPCEFAKETQPLVSSQKILSLGSGWTVLSLGLQDIPPTGSHLSHWHGCPSH